ncbi:hypothetical protein [Rhodoblastus sp.]|uniref:hypothetical protein n=1 Tax=Rhodoblastus sp. TaxID=1962975 RepID=UPI003F94A192
MKTRNFIAQRRPSEPESSFLARLWRKPGDPAIVTYDGPPELREDEKRREDRRRTRLRAGKILDRANRFLTDATIIDRSCRGLRLRLAREVATPEVFHFFDEEAEAIYVARIVWRSGRLLGARRGRFVAATPRRITALRTKFYAMED